MTTAMPSPVGRPQPSILCAPPTDPTGFIYPTYRTAQTVTKSVQRPLKCSHQRSAYVSSAVGGSVSTLSFEDTKTRACYELGRKSHRNTDFTVSLVPSRSLFPAFLSRF